MNTLNVEKRGDMVKSNIKILYSNNFIARVHFLLVASARADLSALIRTGQIHLVGKMAGFGSATASLPFCPASSSFA